MNADQVGASRLASDLQLGRPVAVRHLGGGLGTPPIAVTFSTACVVVKRFGTELDAAERELANLRVALVSDVATPEPLGLDADGAWFGEIAIAMSWVDGDQGFSAPIDESWLRTLAVALAAVHDTSIPAAECIWPIALIEALEVESEDDERMRRVVQASEHLFDDPDDVVFSHGDFHPGNVLFRDAELGGVVDWLDAGPRPRVSDVAYCRAVLAVHPGGDAPDHFLAAYEDAIGRSLDCAVWDAFWGIRGLRGAARRWPAAFAALGLRRTAEEISSRSASWIDRSLHRAGS